MKFQILFIFQFQIIFQLTNAYWWYLGLKVENIIENKKQNENIKTLNNRISFSQNLFDLNKYKENQDIGLRKYCKSFRILNSPIQRKICQRNDKIIELMAKSAKLAIEECQHQFKFKRWNCSIFNQLNVFGRLVQTRSRETAFIYAINSAAAMYEITKACTRGELKGCSCNQNLQNSHREARESNPNIGRYEWGGCSDNVIFGHKLSKHFVDSKEHFSSPSRTIRVSNNKMENMYINKEYRLMNLHNNEVGRRAILKNMKQVCKCHGVSGSCSVKVCWKVMPDFRVIGNELLKRYNLASQIKDTKVKNRVEKLKMIVSRRSIGSEQNDEKDLKDALVFIDKSPNFCKQDPKFSTLGTSGRMCKIVKKSSDKKFNYKIRYLRNYRNISMDNDLETDSSIQTCDYLCCGRGYYSKVIETEEDCDCQFQWCCSVKCKKCKKKVIQYFCN